MPAFLAKAISTCAVESWGLFVTFVAYLVFRMNNKYNSVNYFGNPCIFFSGRQEIYLLLHHIWQSEVAHSFTFFFVHLMHEKKALNVFQHVTSNSVQPTVMNMLSSSAGVVFHFFITISFDKPILHWQYCIIFLSACKLCWQTHKHKLAGILSQRNVC